MKMIWLSCLFLSLILGCNVATEPPEGQNEEGSGHSERFEVSRDAKTGYVIPPDTITVKRYCMTLDLKNDPELIKEYRHWHEPENIWPEITKGIKEVGILDMEIYLYGNRMFLIMETTMDFDLEKDFERMGQLPGQEEWADFVLKFQQSVPGAPEGSSWQLMDRVYNLK